MYVRPDGGDDRSGASIDQAFATLDRAQSAVRAMQPLENDIEIHIAPGLYFLYDTISFGANDSATDGKRITYCAADPKDKPRISGGRLITGDWTEQREGVYAIPVGAGAFRQLYVNGRLAICAREPDVGHWRQIKHWEPMTGTERLKGSGILDRWQRMEQIEFVVKKHWGMSRIHIKSWGTYDGDDVFKPKTDIEYSKAHVPPRQTINCISSRTPGSSSTSRANGIWIESPEFFTTSRGRGKTSLGPRSSHRDWSVLSR